MARKKKKSGEEVKELRNKLDTVMQKLEDSSGRKLEENVEELNEQMNKMVSVNMNLQSKMTELLIKVTDLVRENRELVSLLEEAGEGDYSETEAQGPSSESLLIELKKIESNTKSLREENKKLVEYIKKLYTKNLLGRAIKGRAEPTQEQQGNSQEGNIPLPNEEASVGGI